MDAVWNAISVGLVLAPIAGILWLLVAASSRRCGHLRQMRRSFGVGPPWPEERKPGRGKGEPGSGGAGVRDPRRPLRPEGSGSVALVVPRATPLPVDAVSEVPVPTSDNPDALAG